MRAAVELVRVPAPPADVAVIPAVSLDPATTLKSISGGAAFIPGHRADRIDNNSLF